MAALIFFAYNTNFSLFIEKEVVVQRIISSLLLSIGALISVSASATEILLSTGWEDTHYEGTKEVYAYYLPNYDEDNKIFEMSISHSGAGEQRLYFASYYYIDKNVCSYPSTMPHDSTMIFGGQAVKMLRWCKKFSNDEKYYYSYTPDTIKGHAYVLNLFRTATTPVQIQFDSDILPLPVIGFTKAWNLAGGNAI